MLGPVARINAEYKLFDKKQFINPYNFVPNAEQKAVPTDAAGGELLTGVLRCELITRTPLIIPDTALGRKTGMRADHWQYPFMKIGDQFTIPASSLRGPVRSVYEAATNSCYSTVRSAQVVFNTTKDPFRPGLLKRGPGGWELYEAERYCVSLKEYPDLGKLDYGAPVRFNPDPERKGEEGNRRSFARDVGRGRLQGYLFLGEPIFAKRYESILTKKNQVEIQNQEKLALAVERLKNVLSYYHELSETKPAGMRLPNGYTFYRHIKAELFEREDQMIPVWFQLDEGEGTLHLSLANVGRFAYGRTLNEVLGTYDACRTYAQRCAACDLFGMVGDDDAAAGKVRFTDARLTEGRMMAPVTLAELGNPHITYLPFYMEGAADYDAAGARILGRKFYWHHKPKADAYADRRSNLNATVEPVEIGARFSFQVYYDRVTEKQLRELMWVLCLGENDEKGSMCHKIGHAKPLGFGSVKIVIRSREERTYSAEEGYRVASGLDVEDSYFRDVFDGQPHQESLTALRTILNFDTIPEKEEVRYPYVEPTETIRRQMEASPGAAANTVASHQWYKANFELGREPEVLLPAISGDVRTLKLPIAEAREKTAGSKRRGSPAAGSGAAGRRPAGASGQPRKKGTTYVGSAGGKTKSQRQRKETTQAQGDGGTGSIYLLQAGKTYGYLRSEQDQAELFFHANYCEDFKNLRQGDRVSYVIGTGKDGKPCAVQVRKI